MAELRQQRLEKNKILADAILRRFLKYVSFDTQSNDVFLEKQKPSTPGQMVLAENMKKELLELGISDVTLDEHGFVIAKIPATPGLESKMPICFVSHMDTALEASGKDVKPQIHPNYDLSPIILKNGIVINTENTPYLKNCRGETIISTDGTTLLGGDDKAGIANIMTAFDYILNISKIPHGPLEIMFNCDEETAGGTMYFKPEMLNSRVAYTIDGSQEGVIQYENFNGWRGYVSFHGVAIHPAEGRGRFVNACSMAAAYVNMLPRSEAPESTDGRYGFFSTCRIEGSFHEASIVMLIRDFDDARMEERKKRLEELGKAVEAQFPGGRVEVRFKLQYPNMYNFIKGHEDIVDKICEAARRAGVTPITKSIRGGTDGSHLSRMGVLTPNIWTGSINHHGKREIGLLSEMVSACQTIIEAVKLYAEA